jgi:hypothetical protein
LYVANVLIISDAKLHKNEKNANSARKIYFFTIPGAGNYDLHRKMTPGWQETYDRYD